MSADTRGLSLQTQSSPQIISHLPVFTTEAMVNLSVNQTRGCSSHKWLLVFSTVGLCGNDPRSQIPFGWFLTMWISEPVISVDTFFWPQPAWTNLGKGVPRPLLEPYCYHSYRQHHGGCLFKEWGGGGSQALFVPYYGES